MARLFSRFHAPRQELAEFLASTKGLRLHSRSYQAPLPPATTRVYPGVFAETSPDLLLERKQRRELEDFDTSSSDHDGKYFNAVQYVGDSIMLQKVSKFGLLLHLVAVTVGCYVGVLISSPIFGGLKKVSFLGHWRLLEPAYRDMEIARYKQRIAFDVLMEYD